MRVLLVEDSALLGGLMQGSLTRLGYEVEWLRAREELSEALHQGNVGCIVVDCDATAISFDMVREDLRVSHTPCGVIAIGAPRPVSERIAALDLGADDYVVKPFDLSELAARIRAVHRRRQRVARMDECISHGRLRLNPEQKSAMWDGEHLHLSSREYTLLELMVQRRNQVLSRGQIHSVLHARGTETESNAVEVYIHRLRRKTSQGLILTMRGLGYQLASPIELA
jgi:DNA-binding response OmpR family regulator